ncbi:MAG: hypothetical protein HY040_18195 [Planctomycetes bacterium]|nr:hypothetical protein [Planctomycetota bacterium]
MKSLFSNYPTWLWGALALVLAPSAAWAQYPPPYNPYYPVQTYGPIGNQLMGQASVISATGGLYKDQEQARILRQQADQAKIETKKKSFDEMMYEKAMTPTFTEEMNKNQSMILRRIMTNATDVEIIKGEAQNIILPTLVRVAVRGAYGPPVPLDPEMLQHINVTGSVADGGTGVGMLKNGGANLTWPMSIVDTPTQKQLAAIIPTAVTEVKTGGQLKLDTYKKMNATMDKLYDEVKKMFHKEQIDGGQYLNTTRFLDSLKGSLKILSTPSAALYFNGDYSPKGSTVRELVDYMSDKGLRFGPCNPGFEAPYFALYNAMVAYASGHGEDPSGFVNLNAAKYPQKGGWKSVYR